MATTNNRFSASDSNLIKQEEYKFVHIYGVSYTLAPVNSECFLSVCLQGLDKE